mgnify:CR=1 FL=1
MTPLDDALQQLDHLPQGVTDFEASLLDSCLKRRMAGRALSAKQQACVLKMIRVYLPDAERLVAEVLGQQRLFVSGPYS